MDRRLVPAALYVALASFFLAGSISAQTNVASFRCAEPDVVCVPVTGAVVFEAGETPPPEAAIRVSVPRSEGADEILQLRTPGPLYRFEVRVPRFSGPTLALVELPAPWLDDRRAELSSVLEPTSIELRSAPGVQVTATFQFPQGTIAPPPFTATVQRSPGDRWFVPVEVANGQFSFLARRDVGYSIAASPQGFGNALASFPAVASPHAVTVQVQRRGLPLEQSVVLIEGAAALPAGRRVVQVPVVLEDRAPSGGGPLPYDIAVEPGTVPAGFLSALGVASAGRGQRIALATVSLGNDDVAGTEGMAAIRFTPNPPDAAPAPDLAITLLDDDGADLPPLLTLSGASLGTAGDGASMQFARAEGAPGEAWILTLQLDKPAPPEGAAITVDTVSRADFQFPDPFRFRYAGTLAVEGIDYQPVVNQRIEFAAGEQTATVRIEGIGNDRIQHERRFFLAFTNPEGLAPRDPSIELRIVNDDVDNTPAVRNDLMPVTSLPRSNVLDVLANDVLPAAQFEGGRIEVIGAPQFGSVFVERFGTATPLDDRILYFPTSGNAGRVDRFQYRVCAPLDAFCILASVDVPVRPVPSSSTAFGADADSGFRDFEFSGLPAQPEAQAAVFARPIAANETAEGTLEPDADRFGIDWARSRTVDIPALSVGQPEARRSYVVHLRGQEGSDVDLHVGYDANNDDRIDSDERLCSSSGTGAEETCLVRFTQTPAGATSLRVVTKNPGPTTVTFRLVAGSVEGLPAMPGVTFTLPTRLAADDTFTGRLSWRNDATPMPHGAIGLLRIRNGEDVGLGDLPLLIDLPAVGSMLGETPRLEPIVLRSGFARGIQVRQGQGPRDRVFVDVPAGTGRLAIGLTRQAGSDAPVDVSLRRADFRTSSPEAAVAPAPAADGSDVERVLSDGTLDIVVTNPEPGRWYVVLEDRGTSIGVQTTVTAIATLTASATTSPPVVRPGGFFNPGRAGHGLFLYPASADWAGLWYTYSQDGTPVWYYLQATAPGADGLWTAPIFRSGWNGTSNRLVEVGRATVTPTAPDAFEFTYVLDGEIGSEPFSSFGRGCPGIGGPAVNASGHWFNPSRSGTGYSVQLLPNYEFHAVFAYAPDGTPRFLVAERGAVGASVDTLTLQQLQGFCPLCTRTAFPSRSNVGTLRREFTNGVLSRMVVDATFVNGTPGTWTADDAVIPLGGLQGCAVP